MATTHSGPAAPFTQAEIDKCLTAMIAYAGSATNAIRYLQHNEPEVRCPTPGTLINWSRTTHWERYEQLRETWAAKVEQTVANDMRDAAREAIDVERLAVQRARERLEAGRDDDPAKSAASLARVAQSNVDKLLSLTGRPSQITENRTVSELLRSLVASGALHLADEPEQLEAPADG
jgi:hypothetical protein